MPDVKSVMVSLAASKWDLFFNKSGVKTNRQYCYDETRVRESYSSMSCE